MAQEQTSSTTIPDYIKKPTTDALTGIQDWTKSSENYVYGQKPGESLYTPLTSNQNKSIGNVSWLADQNLADLFGTNDARSLVDEFASFDPGTVGTEKLTDESGYLGSIDSYMSPYLKQVLDPQIREINEALQVGRRDLGAGAQMAGAFGDARHGVTETGIYDNANRQITDVVGSTMADAWTNAMNLRSGDRSAKYTADVGNREAAIGQNQNKATAAGAVAGLGQQYKKDFMDVNDALFNAGEVERTAQEEQRVALQDFQTAMSEKRYNDAMRILGAIQGAPYSTKSKAKTESDDGLGGLIGAGLGALFGG